MKTPSYLPKEFLYKPDEIHIGSIAETRSRLWISLPCRHKGLLRLKPLVGSEAEITEIWQKAPHKPRVLRPGSFPLPKLASLTRKRTDLADYGSARLLMQASQLIVRDTSGPFRSIARLSFSPRTYQFVPLVMALRLYRKPEDRVKLMIADDVGVGKTVEALLIARELYDRNIIKRIAVICPPHLCEQWQAELRSKFGFHAEVLRSTSVGRLEREYSGRHLPLFRRVPFQVISIDYLKGKRNNEKMLNTFISHGPEFIIVDEAHACARPEHASSSNQQLRFRLLEKMATNEANPKHLILLTATPHSGKADEFRSLLGLLHPDLTSYDPLDPNDGNIDRMVQHYIQRRREDITKEDENEKKLFPTLNKEDAPYNLSREYEQVYLDLVNWARPQMEAKENETDAQTKFRYWTLLALLRGALSSPDAGVTMIENRIRNQQPEIDPELSGEYDDDNTENDSPNDLTATSSEDEDANPLINPYGDAEEEYTSDAEPAFVEEEELPEPTKNELESIADKLRLLSNLKDDKKAAKTQNIVSTWLQDGQNPIIFCRYIKTAEYLHRLLSEHYGNSKVFKNVRIEVITSKMNDVQRRERIRDMGNAEKRLLIATDCLSEGINLQEYFTAVLHYDLPWNPNRLEQREGRINRFGQTADNIYIRTLYGENNPIDLAIVHVLLRKAIEIRKDSGVVVSFGEKEISNNIIESMMKVVIVEDKFRSVGAQTSLDYEGMQKNLFSDLDDAKLKKMSQSEKKLRDKLAHVLTDRRLELKDELEEATLNLGSPETVEAFFRTVVPRLGGRVPKSVNNVFSFDPSKIDPDHEDLIKLLPKSSNLRFTFHSPSPPQTVYIGRNHPFMERLARKIVEDALQTAETRVETAFTTSRLAALRTSKVKTRTIVALLRLRLIVQNKDDSSEMLYAEELMPWAFEPVFDQPDAILKLDSESARDLFNNATSDQSMSDFEQEEFVREAVEWFSAAQHNTNAENINDPTAKALHQWLNHDLPKERMQLMIAKYQKQAQNLTTETYRPYEPTMPADALGIYVLLPVINR